MDEVVGCWKYMNTSLHSKRLVRPTGGLYAFTLVGSNTADVRRLATGKACRCNLVAIGVLKYSGCGGGTKYSAAYMFPSWWLFIFTFVTFSFFVFITAAEKLDLVRS